MREIQVDDWKTIVGILNPLLPKFPNQATYLYRGQSLEEWPLAPVLLRLLGEVTAEEAIAIEKYSLQEFKNNVQRYVRSEELPPSIPMQLIQEWWALMQQHGVPTRMLDLTRSPYVGLYFAVESDFDHDGALYIIRASQINNKASRSKVPEFILDYEKHILSASAEYILRIYYPSKMTERLSNQQGAFLYGDHVLTSFQKTLEELYLEERQQNPEFVLFEKLVIPASLKRDTLMRLKSMNITAQTLFSGVDGLGRRIREDISIGLMP